jgi:hypothetical protein
VFVDEVHVDLLISRIGTHSKVVCVLFSLISKRKVLHIPGSAVPPPPSTFLGPTMHKGMSFFR